MTRIVEKAYAKINLALYITDRLPNGYHTLETLFLPIVWHDTLTFEPAETLSLSCNKSELPLNHENLCIKAAVALQKKMNIISGCHIHLHKEIPHGAGLGGGSSDAAATLRALNKLWKLNLSGAELSQLGITLGADVPFFLNPLQAMRGRGIGDVLEPLDEIFPFALLVVFPKLLVPTAWAYRALSLSLPKPAPDSKAIYHALCNTKDEALFSQFINDFEPAVISAHPEIGSVKQMLKDSGAIHAMMSGSGSAVFGIYETDEAAEKASEQFIGRYPNCVTSKNFFKSLDTPR